eukprot:108024_1
MISTSRASDKIESISKIIDRILENRKGSCLIMSDVINAFNAGSRRRIFWDVIVPHLPDLTCWYHTLYMAPIRVRYDNTLMALVMNGMLQGLSSSGIIYPAIKRVVSLNA